MNNMWGQQQNEIGDGRNHINEWVPENNEHGVKERGKGERSVASR